MDMTDQGFTEWVEQLKGEITQAQAQVARVLEELAAAAKHDAEQVVKVASESFTPTYLACLDRLQTARFLLDDARRDLQHVVKHRDTQLATRDTEGSASVQHYIDTGNYLDRVTP